MKSLTWLYPLSATRHLAGVLARRAVPIGLAAIVVSCGENVTAPPESRAPTLPANLRPDVIVMERITDIAAHDSVAAVHRVSKETLTPLTRRTADSAARSASVTPSETHGFDVASLPRPTIVLPARYETAMCSALPSWSRSMEAPTGSGSGSRIETAGVGDAPASTLRVIQDGKEIATMERTWVRTATNWQLARQVVSTPDGRFREVVTYQHLSASGAVIHNELPVAACVTPFAPGAPSSVAASRTFYAPHENPFTAGTPQGTGASRYTAEECLAAYDGDPCWDKQNDVYNAEALVAIAYTAMVIACEPILGPVVVATCTATSIAYSVALANLYFKKRALDHCLADQAAKKAACSCYNYNAFSRGISSGLPGPAMSLSPNTSGTLGSPTRSTDLVCSGDGSSGGGDPGAWDPVSAPGASWECGYADWDISYDGGVTWQYFGNFWTCVNMT